MGERLELKPRLGAVIVMAVFFAVLGGIFIGISRGRHPLPAMTVVGVLMIALPIVLCVLLARRRLVIDDSRVVARGVFGTKVIVWNDVTHYRYWSLGQQGMYVGGGGAAGVLVMIAIFAAAKALRKSPGNRAFSMGGMVLHGSDGTAIKLDLRYKNVAPALDRCFETMHARMRDLPRDYAPFTVGAQELIHDKKGPIALAEIEKITVQGGRISIRKRGKRLAFASATMRATHNAMLFLDDLAERGLVIDANSDVFVPLPVLTKLQAATARHAGLPTAVVVQR